VLLTPNATLRPRLGIVASRKLGDAVRRNWAKRVIREIFRKDRQLTDSLGVDIVVIPRRELFDAAYSSLESDLRVAVKRGVSRLSTHGR
jgi:ribonuclease P protein component